MTNMNDHAQQRSAQRNVSKQAIAYITLYGVCYHKAGAQIFFLRRCDIPAEDLAIDWCARLVGTAVIMAKDGQTVLTTWRNEKTGLKRIKRKPDFSCPGRKDRFNP